MVLKATKDPRIRQDVRLIVRGRKVKNRSEADLRGRGTAALGAQIERATRGKSL